MKKSLETRRKLSLARLGKKHTDETKQKISEGRKKAYTDEERKIKSDVLKKVWELIKSEKKV